ncbi:cysteine desulfurase family protein [Alteribacter aurantiacus]|uniref:cysteine desulfurase family protein n=1 Tax=Alteribacter aurantiacus TaxID=254410 RepID=UPI0004272CB4|nr:IscS subfamily cysteine desulfurase [Alteribacter aurantiacus]
MIFLDYASTSPMSKKALAVYHETAAHVFGNTASLHEGGFAATQIYEASKDVIAGKLGASPDEIFFTSGGTEGNERAIYSLTAPFIGKNKHVITTKIEHPSVLSVFKALENDGFHVTYLDVEKDGMVNLRTLTDSLTKETVLVSIQHGNSEIGTLQPLQEIGHVLNERGILFHTDAVQTFGKIPFTVKDLGVSALTVSAHKVFGPKGVGAVYIKEEVPWNPVSPLTSRSHERGFRPGTINTPGIAAFAQAVLDINIEQTKRELEKIRTFFIEYLTSNIPKAIIEGSFSQRCPHIIGFRIPQIEGQYAMLSLDRYGICVSTGSACQVAKQEGSHVLSSIGKNNQEAREFVRVSISHTTTYKDLKRTVDVLVSLIGKTEEEFYNDEEVARGRA